MTEAVVDRREQPRRTSDVLMLIAERRDVANVICCFSTLMSLRCFTRMLSLQVHYDWLKLMEARHDLDHPGCTMCPRPKIHGLFAEHADVSCALSFLTLHQV